MMNENTSTKKKKVFIFFPSKISKYLPKNYVEFKNKNKKKDLNNLKISNNCFSETITKRKEMVCFSLRIKMLNI